MVLFPVAHLGGFIGVRPPRSGACAVHAKTLGDGATLALGEPVEVHTRHVGVARQFVAFLVGPALGKLSHGGAVDGGFFAGLVLRSGQGLGAALGPSDDSTDQHAVTLDLSLRVTVSNGLGNRLGFRACRSDPQQVDATWFPCAEVVAQIVRGGRIFLHRDGGNPTMLRKTKCLAGSIVEFSDGHAHARRSFLERDQHRRTLLAETLHDGGVGLHALERHPLIGHFVGSSDIDEMGVFWSDAIHYSLVERQPIQPFIVLNGENVVGSTRPKIDLREGARVDENRHALTRRYDQFPLTVRFA